MVGPSVDVTPSLVDLLTVVQRQAARGLALALAEDGCTLDQWRVLRGLGDGEGHAMGELSDALLIAPASLTRVVDGLVDAALAYRRQASADRRRISVHLSRQGRARLDRLEAVVRAHERALRSAPEWDRLRADLGRALGGA